MKKRKSIATSYVYISENVVSVGESVHSIRKSLTFFVVIIAVCTMIQDTRIKKMRKEIEEIKRNRKKGG